MVTSPTNKKEKHGAADFRLFVSYILEHHTVPDVSLNGNMGIFIEAIEALLETLRDDGYEGFVRDLKALQGINKDVNEALSYREPKEDEGDIRTHISKKGRRVFNLLSMDDIDNLPDIEYRVQGILQDATVSLLFGDAGIGKTFLALHFALCIAYGIHWFDHRVRQGHVLYIYAEGIRGLKTRAQAWRKHHNLPKTDNIQFIGFPVHLIEDRETLLATIRSMEEDQGIKYGVVVVDTFSNCSVGISQNDQMEISKVFASAHEIVRDYGCHVLVVHHSNNTGKFNGSAAFRNHVDTMIEVKREDQQSPIIMHCNKQRDDVGFSDISLDLEVVDLGLKPETLEVITSCAVVSSDSKASSESRKEEENTCEQGKMLDILKVHKRLSTRQWIAECRAVDISRRAFYNQLPQLKSQHLIITDEKKGGIYFEVAPQASSVAAEDDNE